jgi:hypothetical protein
MENDMAMTTVARTLCLASLLLGFASPAGAQGDLRSIGRPDNGLAAWGPGAPPVGRLPPIQAMPQRGTDSLWNGTLVGAGLGAVLGALGGVAVIECSECAGFNVPLTFGVIGAGVGAGIGAGIDALRHQRSPTSRVSRPRRVTVAPIVGRHLRAVVGSIRF